MKCNQIGCRDIASHWVYWPGREPLATCSEHTRVAVTIANGIGMYVHTEEISHDTSREGESNSQDSKG